MGPPKTPADLSRVSEYITNGDMPPVADRAGRYIQGPASWEFAPS